MVKSKGLNNIDEDVLDDMQTWPKDSSDRSEDDLTIPEDYAANADTRVVKENFSLEKGLHEMPFLVGSILVIE